MTGADRQDDPDVCARGARALSRDISPLQTRRVGQFTRIGHIPGGGLPLLREGGPISYEARPSASFQPGCPHVLDPRVNEFADWTLKLTNL